LRFAQWQLRVYSVEKLDFEAGDSVALIL